MQIKLFTIPIGDGGSALREMNTFLLGNKIIEVTENFVGNSSGAYWCFSVRYVERTELTKDGEKQKKDYRELLDAPTFEKFSKLRKTRKKIAAEEGISAFIIFTDEELAALAKLDQITEKGLLGIKGIGEKKVSRFGHYFIDKPEENEAGGQPD